MINGAIETRLRRELIRVLFRVLTVCFSMAVPSPAHHCPQQKKRKMAAIVTGLAMAIALAGCGQGASSAREITSEAAAAQFKAGGPDPEGYTRLNGAEVRNLLVGHGARLNNGAVQYFHPDGRVFTTLENATTTSRYVIRGDAVCDERPRGWTCRRIYRDRNGRLFELYGVRPNSLMQIEIERP